jgi:hypothetical protein
VTSIPEWLIQMLLAVAIGVAGWFLRGLRNDVDEIKLDLAKNYVTHRQLRGLRNDLRTALQMMNYLQLELARHFKFKPFAAVPDPASEFDQESGHDGE